MVDFRCPNCATRFNAKDEMSDNKMKCRNCQTEFEVPFPPLEIPDEVIDGGSTVYRHETRSREFEMAAGDSNNIQLISDHIEKHIGNVESVFHELVSDLVHIDVHWIAPTDERPFHTLITSGMSDKPMHPPPELEALAYSELLVCLPPEWPITQEAFEDERNYWPVRWLKTLARFPHEYETWLFEGHTIPNGDPPEPLAPDNEFIGWLLFPPALVPEEFWELKVSEKKTIHFFAIFPLYASEMDLKLNRRTEEVINRFDKYQITEIIDVNRKDVSKKGFWPFR